MNISSLVKALGDTLTAIANSFTSHIERQSESAILKENRKLKKATDIAEKIFDIVLPYLDLFTTKDEKNFRNYLKKFKKYN